MSDVFYIRIRGEVKGPLSREQIVSQIRRKRLGRHHELSMDAIQWQKAGEIPGLFDPVLPIREAPQEPVAATFEPDRAANDSQNFGGQPEDAVEAETLDWYYAKGGNKLGPVFASDIQMWLASGRLTASDLVWNESFDNWIEVGDLPQFSRTTAKTNGRQRSSEAPQDIPPAGFWEIVMGTSRAAMLPADSIHKYPNLTRYLRIAEASLRISFVMSLFLTLAGWLYVVGKGVDLEQWDVVAGAVFAGPIQALLLWFVFITFMAALELIRVVIKIEDNTSQ